MLRQQKLLHDNAFHVQVRFGKNIFLHFSLVSIQVYHYIAVVRTHWWLRSYSSQALEGYKFKAECLFLICLGLRFALNCSFWYVLRFLILKLLRLQDAWTAYDRRTETKEERKRTRTTTQYTSNSLKLVEEGTPQILFLDTKPFISTDELFQVDA